MKNVTAYQKNFQNAHDWDGCLYDGKIDVTTSPDEVQLLKTELIADEMGATTWNMREIIIGKTRIKKEFLLERVEADNAVLLFHCSTMDIDKLRNSTDVFLWINVNGNRIKLVVDIERMLTGRWVRCDVPIEYLQNGLNTVTMYNETEFEFMISIEASRIPNRSAKSRDGGLTWDYDHLGNNDYIDGEYLMRLRLSRYPLHAEILSDFIEIASLATSDLIKPEIKLKDLEIAVTEDIPDGTSIDVCVRGGKTPVYDPENWAHWQDPSGIEKNALLGWRFFQWRAVLNTEDHRVTPVLQEVLVSADIEICHDPNNTLAVVSDENQYIIRGYYNFAYQAYEDERVRLLREEYRLDEVIRDCPTQFQMFRTLAFWLRGMWRGGWEKRQGSMLRTPWDAFIALEMATQNKASGMCTIYSATFIQCLCSLGYTARGVVLDHHFASEVWSDEFKKWVTMDVAASMDSLRAAYYEKDGEPLSSLEMHSITRIQGSENIWIVPSGNYDKIKTSGKHEKGMLGAMCWEPRIGMPLRNNYLTSLLPGELEHGFMEYHYDGYLWWKDSAIPVYEEYTYQSSHERDFNWTLNQAQIFLSISENPDDLNVTLDTVMPNFDRFSVCIDDRGWKESGSEFTWKLHRGENTIQAKSVNKFNREGIVSTIKVIEG